jgi:8-oxo-dGTP pyrophosphatase MutT (NUDIX family)
MPIKVYFDSYHLLITANVSDIKKENYQLIISDEEMVFDFRLNPAHLFNGFKGNIAVITNLEEETLESIFDYADGIVAAGGIVENEKKEVLSIFRRGFWDLPKGKVEKGEKIIDAAQREVLEETGINVKITNENPYITYHCYVMGDIHYIKETHWFDMQEVGKNSLTPQTEEDITALQWMNKTEFESKSNLFYPLIASILTEHFNKH